ncbi:MAG: glycosyltransferase family 9 protein [Candidatus Saganbacteria bacterium]|nr:glycosyltransferase family 9 protein [Candidatus Saganbacteria bacterium]
MLNILIIRPDVIGDCVLITPAITLLRKKYPDAHIAILINKYTEAIFENNPDINQIIFDGDKIPAGFDLSIHFYNELKYAQLAKKAGIPKRIGDQSKPLIGWLYNIKAKQNWNDLSSHEVEHNLKLIEPLGIDISDPPPLRIPLPQKIKSNDFTVGIHLGTGKGNKAWLPERYAKVIDSLFKKYKAKVILTGSDKELFAAETVQKLCKNKPQNLVGKTTLNELISTIASYNIYIGVDTGPMHIAAALKIPTVAIFPTKFVKPTEWGPWKTQHIIVRKAIKCSKKCLPAKCLFDDCLKQIQPEDIILAVQDLLDQKSHNKEDWIRFSYNILTNDDNIQRELFANRYHVVKPSGYSLTDILNIIKKDDINVIHWVGNSGKLKIKLARLLSIFSAPIPPLLIFEHKRKKYNYLDLINIYTKSFKERKYL